VGRKQEFFKKKVNGTVGSLRKEVPGARIKLHYVDIRDLYYCFAIVIRGDENNTDGRSWACSMYK
jgi:hypothetical protein